MLVRVHQKFVEPKGQRAELDTKNGTYKRRGGKKGANEKGTKQREQGLEDVLTARRALLNKIESRPVTGFCRTQFVAGRFGGATTRKSGQASSRSNFLGVHGSKKKRARLNEGKKRLTEDR